MDDDRFHAELLALLRNAYDDIERAKQMGWRDFYYILAAIGAITGLYRAVYNVLSIAPMHHLFFVAPAALMILGIWLVWAAQGTLRQRRAMVDSYYDNLEEKMRKTLKSPVAEPLNRAVYPRLYTAVIVTAAAFATAIMIGLRLSQPCGV